MIFRKFWKWITNPFRDTVTTTTIHMKYQGSLKDAPKWVIKNMEDINKTKLELDKTFAKFNKDFH